MTELPLMSVILTLAICPTVRSVETIVRFAFESDRYTFEDMQKLNGYAEERITMLGGRR